MHIGILDDYMDLVRTLDCYAAAAGEHRISIWTDAERDIDRLAERLAEVEALVLLRERTPVPRALLERLPKLRVITLNGPYPHVDVAACNKCGIALCASHGRLSYATVELTWGLIIAGMRWIPQEAARLKSGLWQSRAGTVLRGRRLGILGYGRIGKEVATIGRAFGMDVAVWSESGREAAAADGFGVPDSREAFFAEADVLSLHLKLVPATRGAVKAADLARMKPSALFVNTSRAGLVEEGALAAALRAGRPGRAAVDVYESEPIVDADHPLVGLDNCICTPHLGYAERDQMENYFADQFRRVRAFAAGRPIDVVNSEALAEVAR